MQTGTSERKILSFIFKKEMNMGDLAKMLILIKNQHSYWLVGS